MGSCTVFCARSRYSKRIPFTQRLLPCKRSAPERAVKGVSHVCSVKTEQPVFCLARRHAVKCFASFYSLPVVIRLCFQFEGAYTGRVKHTAERELLRNPNFVLWVSHETTEVIAQRFWSTVGLYLWGLEVHFPFQLLWNWVNVNCKWNKLYKMELLYITTSFMFTWGDGFIEMEVNFRKKNCNGNSHIQAKKCIACLF